MENFKNLQIGFLGGGNMAQALAKGFIQSGLIQEKNLSCSTPSMAQKFKLSFPNSIALNDNTKLFEMNYLVIIAVKPQYFLESIKNIPISKLPYIISIMAGTDLKTLSQIFSKDLATPKIARVMTNTLSFVKKAISVFCLNQPDDNLRTITKELFLCVGICNEISENLIDAYGGLIGSGPAYVFVMIEALADGAVKMGIPRDQALKYSAHLLVGSAELMLMSGKHPAELKDAVCSPMGTTIYAIHELEKSGIRAALMNAVEASSNRGKQLAFFNLPPNNQW